MTDEKQPVEPKRSRRIYVMWAVAIAAVLFCAGVGLCWPEIQLGYQRYRFRHGKRPQQVAALVWMCKHRFKEGMSVEEVERVLGEPLKNRLTVTVEKQRGTKPIGKVLSCELDVPGQPVPFALFWFINGELANMMWDAGEGMGTRPPMSTGGR